MPANAAVAVNDQLDYAVVKVAKLAADGSESPSESDPGSDASAFVGKTLVVAQGLVAFNEVVDAIRDGGGSGDPAAIPVDIARDRPSGLRLTGDIEVPAAVSTDNSLDIGQGGPPIQSVKPSAWPFLLVGRARSMRRLILVSVV